MVAKKPSTMPGTLAATIGQFFGLLKRPYKVQRTQFRHAAKGWMNALLWPAKLSWIWAMYDTYITTDIKVAAQPKYWIA